MSREFKDKSSLDNSSGCNDWSENLEGSKEKAISGAGKSVPT